MSVDPVGDAWDALYETEMMRCCWCPSCNFYLPADEYKPDSKCVTVAAIEQIITTRLDEYKARAVAAIEGRDHHCATCQCAGTECQDEPWCKRTWRHPGAHSVIRDEDFRTT